ncbi:MAG: hypothetical protein LBF01_05015, partial [Bacteroidales bacterium]|nr:hypothetical protein [Bacteroidales bacterium]
MHIIFSIIIAIAFSVALYLKTKNLDFQSTSLRSGNTALLWKSVLTGFRFLSVFILCFILFSPLVKIKVRQVDKPQLFIALDCSKSMNTNDTAKILSDVNE